MVTMVYLLGIALMGTLQAKSKVQTEVLDEFVFADDMAKGAATEEKMQKGVDQVSDSCDSYDLTISIKKTEVVYQPAPGKPYKEPTITVKGQRLQVVDKFTYLGSTLSRVVHIDDEVNARIAKASAAFGQLHGSIGIELESDLTQNWKYTDPWCCQHYYMHAKLGQFTNRMPKDWTSSIQAVLENFLRSSFKTGFQKSWKGQGFRVHILFWNWHS